MFTECPVAVQTILDGREQEQKRLPSFSIVGPFGESNYLHLYRPAHAAKLRSLGAGSRLRQELHPPEQRPQQIALGWSFVSDAHRFSRNCLEHLAARRLS